LKFVLFGWSEYCSCRSFRSVVGDFHLSVRSLSLGHVHPIIRSVRFLLVLCWCLFLGIHSTIRLVSLLLVMLMYPTSHAWHSNSILSAPPLGLLLHPVIFAAPTMSVSFIWFFISYFPVLAAGCPSCHFILSSVTQNLYSSSSCKNIAELEGWESNMYKPEHLSWHRKPVREKELSCVRKPRKRVRRYDEIPCHGNRNESFRPVKCLWECIEQIAGKDTVWILRYDMMMSIYSWVFQFDTSRHPAHLCYPWISFCPPLSYCQSLLILSLCTPHTGFPLPDWVVEKVSNRFSCHTGSNLQ